MSDVINKPNHYNSHHSGIECIDIVKNLGFLDGNVVKYLWRYEHKNGVEDLKKAQYYLHEFIRFEQNGTSRKILWFISFFNAFYNFDNKNFTDKVIEYVISYRHAVNPCNVYLLDLIRLEKELNSFIHSYNK